MTTATYDDALTMREARQQYFTRWGFDDRGYTEPWVHLKLGPVPFAFPNTATRQACVPMHDLHHVLTEYPATYRGEAQIGAWEVASGCRQYTAAWVLNLGCLGYGALLFPKATFRAFVRGRRGANLYRDGFREELLDERVRDLRRRLRVDAATGPTTPREVAAFAAWLAVAWTLGGVLPIAAAATVVWMLLGG